MEESTKWQEESCFLNLNKQDKNKRVTKVTQMSTLEEAQEEDMISTDEQMPQLISQASKNHLEEEPDDAVTSKGPRASDTHEDTSEESTAAEEIKSDDDEVATEDASPQYTSPSEDSEVEYVETTKGSGNISERVSQSIKIDANLADKALKTFSILNPNKGLIIQEQGPVTSSQASRITDSTKASELNQNNRLKKSKIQAKQKPGLCATKSNLDAEFNTEANKPLTRARARILASQDSQANENPPLETTAEYVIVPTQAPAPSGSRLVIKRLKD